VEFWNEKLDSNSRQGREQRAGLRSLAWDVLVIWVCEAEKPALLLERLKDFLTKGGGEGGEAVDGS
jgi:G:T-mismatch repair DNA endonuclease (very short patch repair protein)